MLFHLSGWCVERRKLNLSTNIKDLHMTYNIRKYLGMSEVVVNILGAEDD
jgi:hypothetical protein